jgi:hypothetical protein
VTNLQKRWQVDEVCVDFRADESEAGVVPRENSRGTSVGDLRGAIRMKIALPPK